MKKKEINEKTFELNITNELLNLSKSFLWYLDESPLRDLYPRGFLKQFFNYNTFFAEGLTQQEEANSGGGYDVSINYKSPNQSFSNRLLFLQYKSGVKKTRCNNSNSQFNVSQKHIRDTKHVLFTFNDAAKNKQHSILRNLANTPSIQPSSVLYVFPRITSKNDFISKVGNLLPYTSFVSVLELDRQASAQTPPIMINNGTVHKYRTSYDGNTSEVNFFFFFFFYSNYTVFELLGELICVQIERFAKAFRNYNRKLDIDFKGWILEAVDGFILDYFGEFTDLYKANENIDLNGAFNLNEGQSILRSIINDYLGNYQNSINLEQIPQAPQNFSTVVPEGGLSISFEDEDLGSIQYQVF